jgi:hypothetical protein
MKKHFLIIIAFLFVNTIQVSQDTAHFSLANNLGNIIWHTLAQWFSGIKKPLITNKQMIGIGAVGALAIAGTVWWYTRPPKNSSFDDLLQRVSRAEIDRNITETQESIDRSDIDNKNRKQEFSTSADKVAQTLNKIEQSTQKSPTGD